MHGEINIRLSTANRCLYALKTQLKFKLLSRKTDEHLHIMYVRPVLTYACAIWATTREVMNKNYVYLKEKFLGKFTDPYLTIWNRNRK